MANDKVSKEEKREKERMRDEQNCETRQQCVDLKRECARCYPGCTIPNYHLPWRFVKDLMRGETFKRHARDTPRNIEDGEAWNKEWCTVEKKYI